MKLIKDKVGRRLWTINFQSFRIVGKFLLTEKGFQNISKLINQIFNTVKKLLFFLFVKKKNSVSPKRCCKR